MHRYFAQCENIYQLFVSNQLQLSDGLMRHGIFQLEYVPDPYLIISGHREKLQTQPETFLHVLTTNPGQGVPYQKRGSKCLRSTYAETSDALLTKYREHFGSDKSRRNALVRIKAIEKLALCAGFDGVIQVEMFPWHSPVFDKRLLPALRDCELTASYFEALTDYLRDKQVLTVDAVKTTVPVSADSFRQSDWIIFKSDLIGFDFDAYELLPILHHKKRGHVTGAALRHQRTKNAVKVLFGVGGSNRLPGPEGLRRLSEALR